MTYATGGYTGQTAQGTVPVWWHEAHWCLTSPQERRQGKPCDFIISREVMERIITCKTKE